VTVECVTPERVKKWANSMVATRLLLLFFFFYFADFQFTVFDTEDNLQEAASKLTQIIK